jgi:hypothetical protein
MANLSGIVKQLKEERDRVEQLLSGLNAALAAFAGMYRGTAKPHANAVRCQRNPERRLQPQGEVQEI